MFWGVLTSLKGLSLFSAVSLASKAESVPSPVKGYCHPNTETATDWFSNDTITRESHANQSRGMSGRSRGVGFYSRSIALRQPQSNRARHPQHPLSSFHK